MKPILHFPEETLAAAHKGMVIGLRAGSGMHRFIGVWAVVVEKRVFIRSWSLKPDGWHRAFLKEPRGTVQIAGQEFSIRAVQTKSERLLRAIDQAYLEKYKTPGAVNYVQYRC